MDAVKEHTVHRDHPTYTGHGTVLNANCSVKTLAQAAAYYFTMSFTE